MYICSCRKLSTRDVAEAAARGERTLKSAIRPCGAEPCGTCNTELAKVSDAMKKLPRDDHDIFELDQKMIRALLAR